MDSPPPTTSQQTLVPPSLDEHGVRLKRLVKLIAKPADALREAETFDWAAFLDQLRGVVEAQRAQHGAALEARREALLRAAQAAGEPAERLSQSDRIGVFQVEYSGGQTIVTLGGVRVETVKESDGAKLYGRLQKLRATLDAEPFVRDEFFQMLKAAETAARRAGGGGDEFVPLRDLHHELIFERARRSDKFRRTADMKTVPAYPLHQFVFDLARFVREGVAVGSERLATQPPSMRENKETVQIPNLDHPLVAGTAVARLAIRPV